MIDNLLKQARDMALAWALRLTGLHDQDKFKALDWGLRTWDQWQFNDCDDRFGSDWPGRIPAQLVAHTLYYFSRPGDRVLDPSFCPLGYGRRRRGPGCVPMNTPGPAPSWRFSMPTGATLNPPRRHKKPRTMP